MNALAPITAEPDYAERYLFEVQWADDKRGWMGAEIETPTSYREAVDALCEFMLDAGDAVTAVRIEQITSDTRNRDVTEDVVRDAIEVAIENEQPLPMLFRVEGGDEALARLDEQRREDRAHFGGYYR